MQADQLYYDKTHGWSKPFPDLNSKNTLILIFFSPDMVSNGKSAIDELISHYPDSIITGCSTAGEIMQDEIRDKGMSIVIILFEQVHLRYVDLALEKNDDGHNAGTKIAKRLNDSDLKHVFVLSVGLNINGTALIKGINHGLDENVILSGGLAADEDKFQHTWVLSQGEFRENYIAAIGFYGESLMLGHASKGGWDVFGPVRRITNSTGNIVYQIDNQPALALYKKYLGQRASELPASALLYPMAVFEHMNEIHKPLVRTILAIDEVNQSMTFAGDMPQGYYAQLMHANFERLIDSAGQASEHAIQTLDDKAGQPVVAIAVSCVGRRLLLGEYCEEELTSVHDMLPKGSILSGFYSYGELSPSGAKSCDLHNQTMTLTIYQEKGS